VSDSGGERQDRPRGQRSVRRPAAAQRGATGPGARGGQGRRETPGRRDGPGRREAPGPPRARGPGQPTARGAEPRSRGHDQPPAGQRRDGQPRDRQPHGLPPRGSRGGRGGSPASGQRGERPARPARPARRGTGPPRRRPRRKNPVNRGDPDRRLRCGLLCIAFALSLFAARLVQLQGMDGAQYRTLADRQRVQTVELPAVRGTITAADGSVLAETLQTDIVYADPKLMTAVQQAPVAEALAGPLGMTEAAVLALVQHPSSPQYVVLKRGVAATTGDQISLLSLPGSDLGHLPGIGVTPAYSSVYPNGDLAASLIGFTDTDAAGNLKGEAGIEEEYNSLLAGRDGAEEIQTTTNGQPIPLATDVLSPTVPGRDVRLTILPGLQWAAEQACEQRVIVTKADYCTAVVMQPHTGQILALAQYPTFSPADPSSVAATTDDAVANVFQPGSTAKVITVAAALEHGGQTLMSPYTVPDQIVVDGYPFHDAEYHPTERLTIAGILAMSSNVGMVQVVQHVSPRVQYSYLRAFGLGESTGLNLPGASEGILYPASQWWGDERYTLAFGQGVAANAVQMASVYATLANGGVRVQPSIVAGTTSASGQFVPSPAPPRHRVIKAKTASELIRVLEQVPMVDAEAGVPWGEIAGYPIAAKTGTAQEWSAAKHCLCDYGSSYIGMAPANNPQVVVAINVQNPKGADYYGDEVAGPVFYQVMRSALQTLKIPPNYAERPDVRLTAP
jgi:cell division protein FtsI (penicillin-binding protein 3)